jgi:hypothetical protein
MINDKMISLDNIQNDKKEKNKVKLFLETCLGRKVDITSILLNKERKDFEKVIC